MTATLFLYTIGLAAAQEAPAPTGGQPWDFRNREQAGQLTFYDTPIGATVSGQPIAAGDFDNNGCGDVAAAGMNHSFAMPEGFRVQGGHIRIIMNICEVGGVFDMEADPGHTVLTVFGARRGDVLGTELYVGDFNGDGFDDLLFSAQNHDGPDGGRANAGAVYLMTGGVGFADRDDIDLAAMPEDILVFHGATEQDRLGLWVEGGDSDGDGFDDLLLGANQADGENDARPNSGEVWALYGAADLMAKYSAVTDLRFPPADATRIIGADADDLFGSTVYGGDVNGDGIEDIIASAALWRGSAGLEGLAFGGGDGPANGRFNSGEVYVIFGDAGLRGQTIDLRAKLDPFGVPRDTSLTVIYGADANNLLGEELTIGDMNGDGRNELMLGALISNGQNNRMIESGEAWVISTHEPFAGQAFDLSRRQPERAVAIFVDQPFSKAGDTMVTADIDGDGFDDLLYGAPDYDSTSYDLQRRPNAGLLVVIFGQEGNGLPPNTLGELQVFDPPDDVRLRFFVGADASDMTAYGLQVYDFDGDGVIDIMSNGMGGDGPNNDRVASGEFYIVSGAEFLSPAHQFE